MRIVIIGGGVAGMFAAISAKKKYIEELSYGNIEPCEVLILEKNEKLGKKLFITGKGRCNVTNAADNTEFFKNIVHNEKFFYSSYNNFSNKDLMKLIEENGCRLKVERGNRVFPKSDKSYDIIDSLKNVLKKLEVIVKLNSEVTSVTKKNDKFIIMVKNSESVLADKIVIATGGKSYESTGSTGDGYKFAKSFGIEVTDIEQSLVPFNVEEVIECKSLQGLTLKNVEIKIYSKGNKKKTFFSEFGELLFTHFGISGPIVLSSSCFVTSKLIEDSLIASIDLKPALTYEQVDKRLIREFESNKLKKLSTIMESLLPNKMVDIFLDRIEKQLKKPIKDIRASEIDKTLRTEIVNLLKCYEFNIVSKRGFNEAIITSGGIDVKELNPKTMESKKISGLYFAGEVIDLDAMTGGFNIQIAASTGFTAGLSVI